MLKFINNYFNNKLQLKKEQQHQQYLNSLIGQTCKIYTDDDVKDIEDYIRSKWSLTNQFYLGGFKVDGRFSYKKGEGVIDCETDYPDMFIEDFIINARNKGIRVRHTDLYNGNKIKSRYNGDKYYELCFILTYTTRDLTIHQGLENYLRYIKKFKKENYEKCKERHKLKQAIKQNKYDKVENIL